MRYYVITISDTSGNEIKRYSSLASDGSTLMGALNIELDIPLSALASPAGASYVRIWGISIADVGQATDLFGKIIRIYAGMAKGLPLANPAQNGLILEAMITQAFGNWQGTVQTLDIIAQADAGASEIPKNIVLNWRAGTTLSATLKNTIATAFPDYSIIGLDKINQNLVQSFDDVAPFQTAVQLAQYIRVATQRIIGGSYSGVGIIIKEKQFVFFDGTSATAPKAIAFIDLVGQPTWIEAQTIQIKTIMRADINLFDLVSLPKGPIAQTAQSYSQYRDSSQFTGNYYVVGVRHVGCYRQRDGNAWVTIIDATPEYK